MSQGRLDQRDPCFRKNDSPEPFQLVAVLPRKGYRAWLQYDFPVIV